MINFKRADHIHICVPPERLEEARRFYTNIIGLEPTERPLVFSSAGYWFRIADIELHIGVEDSHTRSIRHTAFEVNDVAAARKHLENQGLEIMEEPLIVGRERFAFIDPFGNRMELLQMI
ncbi:VOC family protein [Mucilaginibacter lappiensis]|uniref:Catechol 2,3-dioxygenase-like lactoylglutathione lyase family enzyme n=1 Tax=Mucilaginibacter lappiensis TaxID=354630 RepID=A0A841JHQ5_9SPHI|nr:VOC family protein [Mucilaginibacter lappiensis]MBB6130034.1 catechol 2,3-dioxygenase-like lactoylglutathione lyase family enzyme [Mucilaginibacter lappiensis]